VVQGGDAEVSELSVSEIEVSEPSGIGVEVNEPAKITAIAPWFGGKRTMAPVIVQELGEHSTYWELFCGSMAVLCAKPVSGHETVNDLHGDLINLAMVVRSDRAHELYERLARTLYVDAVFDMARAIFCGENDIADLVPDTTNPERVGDKHVERAYWYFVVSWMGRNGVSGTERSNYQMATRWTPGGGHGGQRFAAATDSIPWWHNRLRRVCILRRDAFDLLGKIDDAAGVAIYVDPPYFTETRGDGGGSRYLHDFGDEEHERLAAGLERFTKARVVVSYYDHVALDRLYAGWTKREVHRNKNLHVQNRRGAEKSVAPEVLLINGESFADRQEAALFE